MSKKCAICGKGPMVTLAIQRAGSRLRSGKRRYTKSKTKRRQLPNLQKTKIRIDGKVKRVNVCASCLSSHKAEKVI